MASTNPKATTSVNDPGTPTGGTPGGVTTGSKGSGKTTNWALGGVAAVALIAAIWGWSRDTSDPQVATLLTRATQAEQKVAGLTSERDRLVTEQQGLSGQVNTLTSERDRLATEQQGLSGQVNTLTSERQVLTQQQGDTQRQLTDLETARIWSGARVEGRMEPLISVC